MRIESNKKRPISKLASKIYTPEKIAEKARTGYHGNETMMQVFKNIVHDPHIVIADPDKKGNSDIFYDGKNIGWMNIERGMGWIDDKAYDKLQKYVEPELPLASLYEEDYGYDEDEYDEDEDEEYDDEDNINASNKITAADDNDILDDAPKLLKDALKAELEDTSLMTDTVNAIYAKTGDFDRDVFMDAEDFYDLNSKKDLRDLVLDFFNGEDLETGKDGANPSRAYLRRDAYDHVESTDDPGRVYVDEILDEVVDYILDNSEETYYPDDILDILNEYVEEDLDNNDN